MLFIAYNPFKWQFSLDEIKLAIFTLLITISIAFTQQIQLKKLEDIGNQTKDTTIKLNTESSIIENVNKFFMFNDKNKKNNGKYNCYFPVEFESKPLPLIKECDYYAIHILSTRLGENNLFLKRVPKNEEFVDESIKENNAIFICAPTTNLALNTFFGFKELKNESDKKELEKWPFKGLEIPCWFVEDYLHLEDPEIQDSIRKIKIYNESTNELLTSPAEEIYKKASKLENGEKFNDAPLIQRDYGIFARLNKYDHQYIIIAGIHQYGTWIVASLLGNLLDSKIEVDYESIFMSNDDFIAVIGGEFDTEKLIVNSKSIEVVSNFIWTKKDKKWIRQYRS